jgi:hypothetical protein
MTIPHILAQDAERVNAIHIPPGMQAAGYTTGFGNVPWDAPTFAAHNIPFPAIHIDQDPSASDSTADILDVESLAATVADIPGWLTRARANYANHVRPAQRWPGIYCSMNTLNTAIAICTSNKFTNVPFWTAEPGNTQAFAINRVATAVGPFPCIGCQYDGNTFVDFDVFSLDWVQKVSGPVPTVTTGTQNNWLWCHKCQGLFYGPHESISICPEGGMHDGSKSFNYSLNWTN